MSSKLNEVGLLIGTKTSGVNALADAILQHPDGPEGELYKKAWKIRSSKAQKQYIEACLLCKATYEEMAEILEIPAEVVKMYNDVFYNVTELSHLEKIEALETETDIDDRERILKTWALHQGLKFIAWRLGKATNINPQEGLVELFGNCVYKSKEALFVGNAAEASKESTKWVKLSLDIARLLKLWQLESVTAASKDLEFAIREVVPEFRSLSELMELNTSNTDVDVKP